MRQWRNEFAKIIKDTNFPPPSYFVGPLSKRMGLPWCFLHWICQCLLESISNYHNQNCLIIGKNFQFHRFLKGFLNNCEAPLKIASAGSKQILMRQISYSNLNHLHLLPSLYNKPRNILNTRAHMTFLVWIQQTFLLWVYPWFYAILFIGLAFLILE